MTTKTDLKTFEEWYEDNFEKHASGHLMDCDMEEAWNAAIKNTRKPTILDEKFYCELSLEGGNLIAKLTAKEG
jgi:hypothetical protein